MKIKLVTLQKTEDTTLGALYIDEEFCCFTLEDAIRKTKVLGKTAIPEGTYDIQLRKGSPMAKRYDQNYHGIGHNGMLWLKNVPNFEWIYFHPGNNHTDTEGCILVGDSVVLGQNVTTIGRSRVAYQRLYPKVRSAIESGQEVSVEISR